MLHTAFVLLIVTPVVAGEPHFEVRTRDDVAIPAGEIRLASDGTLKCGEQSRPIADVLTIQQSDSPRPAWPRNTHAILANGDRIAGDVLGGDGLSLRFAARFGAGQPVELPLPLSSISAIWFAAPPADHAVDVARYAWIESGKKQDVLKLRNGDVIRGTLERFAPGGGPLRFKPAGEATAKPFDLNTIAALAFDSSLSRVKPQKGIVFRVVTRVGSRLTLVSASCDSSKFQATTATGAKLEFPLGDLIALEPVGNKSVELAELIPKTQKFEPYGRVMWPMVPNRSVREAPLRLLTARGDETFDRGLGMHSQSTVTYSLAGKYKTFVATVGLDAGSGRQGAVDIRVMVDGKDQAISGAKGLTAEKALELRIDVTAAKEMTLVVEYGPGGDVQDDVNWAGAKLLE